MRARHRRPGPAIPCVQNAAEAAEAVAATRYPTHGGVRGFTGLSRASRFGRIPDYHDHAHEEICVIVQVEANLALSAASQLGAALCRTATGYLWQCLRPFKPYTCWKSWLISR